jgi:agmatinase
MRSTLAAAVLASGLLKLGAAHDQHEETIKTQEPFVGWTQEDLDAKWGTDVCSMTSTGNTCD